MVGCLRLTPAVSAGGWGEAVIGMRCRSVIANVLIAMQAAKNRQMLPTSHGICARTCGRSERRAAPRGAAVWRRVAAALADSCMRPQRANEYARDACMLQGAAHGAGQGCAARAAAGDSSERRRWLVDVVYRVWALPASCSVHLFRVAAASERCCEASSIAELDRLFSI